MLAAVVVLTVAAFVVVSRLHFGERVNAYLLIDDPAPFAGLPSHTGLLSYAGVVAWCAATTVCAFGGWLLRGVRGARELSGFLLILAAFNAWLALDDLLVIHEDVGEAMMGFDDRHIGEAFFFVAYAVGAALCFWRFRATVLRTEYLLLLVAAVPFGISIALDVVLQMEMGGNNIFLEAVISRSWGGPVVDISEDLLKLAGVALWCAYLTRVAYHGIQDAMRQTAPRPAGSARKDRRSGPLRPGPRPSAILSNGDAERPPRSTGDPGRPAPQHPAS